MNTNIDSSFMTLFAASGYAINALHSHTNLRAGMEIQEGHEFCTNNAVFNVREPETRNLERPLKRKDY